MLVLECVLLNVAGIKPRPNVPVVFLNDHIPAADGPCNPSGKDSILL